MLLHRALTTLLAALALTSCGVREPGASPVGPSAIGSDCGAAFLVPTADAAVPTAPPAPTAAPAPAASPAPTEVVTREASSYEDKAATAVAQATAQPFLTAEPSEVRSGQPAEAHGSRGGLHLALSLWSDRLLAGEATQATFTLKNDGAEPLFITGDGQRLGWLLLLDERGDTPEPWPWAETARPGGAFLLPLAPGAALSTTLTLQLPPDEAAAGHSYTLWAATRFARAVPGTDGPDNVWLQLEAGPIPLTLSSPRAEQQLRAALTVDHDSYTLRAVGADGQPVSGAWGELETSISVPGQFDMFSQQPLSAENGTWSGVWDRQFKPEQAQIAARAWAAAPGYVTATVTETLSGTPLTVEETALAFQTGAPPCRQQFADPAAAQVALGLPLARLTLPPAGAALVGVAAEVVPAQATFTTRYELANGAWLALTQRATSERYDSAGWGAARYDPEASVVAVGATQGYLIRRYGVWTLNWKPSDTGLELRAPLGTLAADDLVQLAVHVQTAP